MPMIKANHVPTSPLSMPWDRFRKEGAQVTKE
jgi:hypothetical protein